MARNIRIKFTVNKSAGRDLARQMRKNARRKGIQLKVDERELQQTIEKAFKGLK